MIKEIRKLNKNLRKIESVGFWPEERKALHNALKNHQADFQAGEYRFIHKAAIDTVMLAELEGNLEFPDLFEPRHLAEVSGKSLSEIKKCLETDGNTRKLAAEIVYNCGLPELMEHLDYGVYFATEDALCHDLGVYYMFKIGY